MNMPVRTKKVKYMNINPSMHKLKQIAQVQK